MTSERGKGGLAWTKSRFYDRNAFLSGQVPHYLLQLLFFISLGLFPSSMFVCLCRTTRTLRSTSSPTRSSNSSFRTRYVFALFLTSHMLIIQKGWKYTEHIFLFYLILHTQSCQFNLASSRWTLFPPISVSRSAVTKKNHMIFKQFH